MIYLQRFLYDGNKIFLIANEGRDNLLYNKQQALQIIKTPAISNSHVTILEIISSIRDCGLAIFTSSIVLS